MAGAEPVRFDGGTSGWAIEAKKLRRIGLEVVLDFLSQASGHAGNPT